MRYVHLITIWIKETLPSIREKSSIVKMTTKSDRSLCDNFRGSTRLPVPTNTRIVIQIIQYRVVKQLLEKKAGFRRGRNTT